MTLVIIPQTIDGEIYGDFKKEDLIRASYCYLHGELEDLVGYDIFYLLKNDFMNGKFTNTGLINDSFVEGIYPCKFENKECSFFFWRSFNHNHGLVVLNSDIKSYQYALEQYTQKAICI